MQTVSNFPRVAVDRRRILWREGTGVARYRDILASALAHIGAAAEPVDDGGDGAARAAWRDLPRILHGQVRAERLGSGWRVPDLYRLAQRHFSLTGAPLEVSLPDPPPIAHWSHPLPLRLAGAANLYTVHDLIPIEAPELTAMSGARQVRMLTRLAAEGAQFVTVSETVRGALRRRFELRGDRVTCCYQAVEPGEPGALPAGLDTGGYFLVLGRVETRKNIERLIQAHHMSDSPLPLVLCGPEGAWASRAERARVQALIGAHGVRQLGWQDGATVAALIAGARAVLMPSLAEGFGLPAVEAMRMGVPAMAPSSGAAAEIAGEAALLVDPEDVEAIARGIARLGGDAALRAKLIAAGRDRAREFGIESFAARLTSLYERFV